MSDVTHYARARKWLDDPNTDVPESVRADLNAALAISTAQRETEKTIGRLVARVDALSAEVAAAVLAARSPVFVSIAGRYINPGSVACIEATAAGKEPRAHRSILHVAEVGQIRCGLEPAEAAEVLGVEMVND